MRKFQLFVAFATASLLLASCNCGTKEGDTDFVSQLKLSDYKPVSIFKVPVTDVKGAKFATIDMHSHAYVDTPEDLKAWVKAMDENNIEKAIIHTGAYGAKFDSLYAFYKTYPGRFDLWCGFDMSSWGTPDFPAKAVAELERCYKVGARGVGELSDKGLGERESRRVKEPGLHFDDDLFVPLFSKCAELGMPVNMHLGDPIWMYEPMDAHNDGYMNAYEWKIDLNTPGILDLDELVATLEKTCDKNPNTQFIACHFINIGHDYEKLGEVLDRHPKLMIDNSARHLESSATPKASKRFYEKYSDRIVFGTDNTPNSEMYRLCFRIIETEDEHFYPEENSYHWALNGIGVSDPTLKKLYKENALRIYNPK